jgi:hypothetical protein
VATRPENAVTFDFPSGQSVSFDADAFDEAIISQGVPAGRSFGALPEHALPGGDDRSL